MKWTIVSVIVRFHDCLREGIFGIFYVIMTLYNCKHISYHIISLYCKMLLIERERETQHVTEACSLQKPQNVVKEPEAVTPTDSNSGLPLAPAAASGLGVRHSFQTSGRASYLEKVGHGPHETSTGHNRYSPGICLLGESASVLQHNRPAVRRLYLRGLDQTSVARRKIRSSCVDGSANHPWPQRATYGSLDPLGLIPYPPVKGPASTLRPVAG